MQVAKPVLSAKPPLVRSPRGGFYFVFYVSDSALAPLRGFNWEPYGTWSARAILSMFHPSQALGSVGHPFIFVVALVVLPSQQHSPPAENRSGLMLDPSLGLAGCLEDP